MSGRHATISAWQRREEGGYEAEIEGWKLHVEWHPEGNDKHQGRRGFTWSAEKGSDKRTGASLFEEIEQAMADAELVAAPKAT